SGWTASFDNSLDPNVSIVVDGQSANAVFIEKIAQFTNPPANGVFTPLDITFTQTAAGALPNIVIDDEILTNQTGAPWLDFHMEFIGPGPAFIPGALFPPGAPPPIGFSISPFTTAVFGNAGSGPNTGLDIAGGVIAPGATWSAGTGPGGDGQLWIT